jgi:hypothetical protein
MDRLAVRRDSLNIDDPTSSDRTPNRDEPPFPRAVRNIFVDPKAVLGNISRHLPDLSELLARACGRPDKGDPHAHRL